MEAPKRAEDHYGELWGHIERHYGELWGHIERHYNDNWQYTDWRSNDPEFTTTEREIGIIDCENDADDTDLLKDYDVK